MADLDKITVEFLKEEKTNGLGMMIGQYLEQNLEEFEEKVKQGLKLHLTTSVEVEKGISTTVKFDGDRISIRNGVAQNAHLHLKSSYMTLADVLTGKINPFKGVISGKIKIVKMPVSKPLQSLKVLSFLKIPEELIIKSPQDVKKDRLQKRVILFLCGLGCGLGLAYLFVLLGWF
jgi:putative sterol carrier protein